MVRPATPPTTPPTRTGVGGMDELFVLPAAADVVEDGGLAVAVPPPPIPPPMAPPVLDDPLVEALAVDVVKVEDEAEAEEVNDV